MTWLIAWRAVQGLGAGGLLVTATCSRSAGRNWRATRELMNREKERIGIVVR